MLSDPVVAAAVIVIVASGLCYRQFNSLVLINRPASTTINTTTTTTTTPRLPPSQFTTFHRFLHTLYRYFLFYFSLLYFSYPLITARCERRCFFSNSRSILCPVASDAPFLRPNLRAVYPQLIALLLAWLRVAWTLLSPTHTL